MPDRDASHTARPVIRVLNHDLIAALAGRTMGVSDETGQEYNLRLFTAEEFIEVQHALVERSGQGSKISPDKAADLTQPVDLFKFRG